MCRFDAPFLVTSHLGAIIPLEAHKGHFLQTSTALYRPLLPSVLHLRASLHLETRLDPQLLEYTFYYDIFTGYCVKQYQRCTLKAANAVVQHLRKLKLLSQFSCHCFLHCTFLHSAFFLHRQYFF